MKTLTLILLIGASLFAQAKPVEPKPAPESKSEAPKLPDAVLAKYWHAIAAHHSETAAFLSSLTANQKHTQESIEAIDKEIDARRKELAEACGEKYALDEHGADPACVLKPEPAKPESKTGK